MIRRLKYNQVDWKKYQQCLNNSEQKKYSAEKKFLDVVSGKNWEVLVYEDYDAVMPITFIRKIGIKIVVNSILTQQLGIYSKKDTPRINEQFLKFLQKNYYTLYYAFNEKNQFISELKTRKNFLLEQNDYETVFKKYSPKRKRKLRLNPGIIEYSQVKDGLNYKDVEKFIFDNMIGIENNKGKMMILNILKEFYENGYLDFYGFFFKEKLTNLVALYQEKYVSVLLGTYNIKELIKYNGASNLINFAIQKNVETRIFDFEGGDLPNMEEYFRGFRGDMKFYSIIQNSKKELIKKIINIFGTM